MQPEMERDYHPQQHPVGTYVLARNAKNVGGAVTHPEYTPISAPLGTLTVGRTPHPRSRVLNTCNGIFRGFCATRVLHVSSQAQFYHRDKNDTATLGARLTMLHSLSSTWFVPRRNKPWFLR